ncbi:MAG: MarR family winged helix-turn-helix transcriptional regulator [Acidaminobacteraceae bacterium]
MANYYNEVNHMMEKVMYKFVQYDKSGIKLGDKQEKYSFLDVIILREIGKLGEITVFDLINQVEVDRGILSTSINRFINLGFVVKLRSRLDKRKFVIYLTDEGKKFYDNILKSEVEELNFILKDMTVNEQKTVLKFLSRLNQLTVERLEFSE